MATGAENFIPTAETKAQPPEYGAPITQDDRLREGFYMLRNKKTRTVAELYSPGDAMNHSRAYRVTNSDMIGRQMWLIQHSSRDGTYTLKNLDYSKYLEVKDGCPSNGAPVIPRPRQLADEVRLNQEWRIEEVNWGEYTLKCARTNTLLEVPGGDASDGVKVTCSEATAQNDHQVWILSRVSRTSPEIKTILESWKPSIAPRMLQPHTSQIEYFVLPHAVRQLLWEGTKLLRQPVRIGVFDYNDFVIRAKDAVSSWARDTYPIEVQGVSFLFGIIYGEAGQGPKAYNWYLTRDMRSLVFFDAQTGEEYSPAALDDFGFEPTFVTF